MGGVEPQTFYTFLGVLHDVVADFLEELVLRYIKPTNADLEHFDVLTGGENPTNIAEEAIQNLLLREMAVPKALQLDVGDLPIPGLVRDIVLEFSEPVFIAEEIGVSHVELGDLGGIEDHGHLFV